MVDYRWSRCNNSNNNKCINIGENMETIKELYELAKENRRISIAVAVVIIIIIAAVV